MYYKNLSHSTKTFYGVEFKPGEIKEVASYINHKDFIIVAAPAKVEKVEPAPVKASKKAHSVEEPAEEIKEPNNKEEKLDGTDSNQ